MAAAAQGAGSSGGKAAAERAANDVFEANLDTVVAMGWANVVTAGAIAPLVHLLCVQRAHKGRAH